MEYSENYFKTWPKGELHVHLNGLVSPRVVRKIAQKECVVLPVDFNPEVDLVRIEPSLSLQAYLKPWELLRLIPNERENLKVLMENAFSNLKADNVQFAEIRNSVLYIAIINDVSVDTAMGWLIEDLEEYSEKYKIKSGLILTTARGDYSCDHLRALLKAYEKLGKPCAVIGLDLAGNENLSVDSSLGLQFMQAKQQYGFKITVHAGETGFKENIISAVKEYGADRIGHGTAAGECIETMSFLRKL